MYPLHYISRGSKYPGIVSIVFHISTPIYSIISWVEFIKLKKLFWEEVGGETKCLKNEWKLLKSDGESKFDKLNKIHPSLSTES